MDDNRFDDLTKVLANGVSRREALRKIGAGLAAAVLTGIGIQKVTAAPPPCAVLCGKTSFTSGPAHAACLQACRKCEADITRLCFSPTGTVCCAPGMVCTFDPITGRAGCAPNPYPYPYP